MSTPPSAAVPQAAPKLDAENPYAGLQPFAEHDSPFFFGRDTERDELARLVRREVLTVVFGRSGLGKTSLLNAGLFPLLRQERYLPLPIRLDFSRVGGRLATQIGATVREVAKAQGIEVPELQDDETLWEYFHRTQLWNERNRLLTPLLVIDQFEEIFTLGHGDARLQPLLVELGDLIENRIPLAVRERLESGEDLPFSYERQSFRVIFSLREDFLPQLEDLCPLIPSLARNRFRLAPMKRVQALEAILRPAGSLVSEGVERQIVDFLESPEDMTVEPALLSLFCRELNDKRQVLGLPVITGDLVAGERQKILTNFYERCMSDLPRAVRLLVEDRLLTGSGFRRSEALDDALRVRGVKMEAITALVSRRLLALERRLGDTQVELIHDVLTHVIQESRDRRHRRESRRRMVRQMAAGVAVLAILTLSSLAIAIRERRLKEGAELERSRAEAERSRAEDLISFMLFDLRDGLAKIGRLDLLGEAQGKAYSYFKDLPEEGQTDDTQRNRSVAFDNLGEIFRQQGKSEQALELYRRAFAIRQDLARKDPKNLDWQRDLEVSHGKLASILEGRLQHSKALLHYKAALTIAKDLAKRDSEDTSFQEDILRIESDLGNVLLRLGNAQEAVEHLNKAVVIAKNLTESNSTDRDLQGILAGTHLDLGLAELNYGQVQKAMEHYQSAIDLGSRLMQESPSDLQFRRILVDAYHGLGSALEDQGKTSMALASYSKAFDSLTEVANRSDLSATIDFNLATIINRQASALIENRQTAMGLEKADKARQVFQRLTQRDPGNAQWQGSLATSFMTRGEALLAQGQAKAAIREFEQAVRIETDLTTRNPGSMISETALGWSHFLAGRAREALGDTAGARKEWTLAQQFAGPWAKRAGFSGVLSAYARASIALGSLEEARPFCEQLLARGWNYHRILDLCREKALLP